MTYISAFECQGGIVLCADTQESHEASAGHKDEKEYVEKLYIPEMSSFPIAIGGAGLDEPIEIFSLELFERIEKQKPPATIAELRAMIQSSLEVVHESDTKVSAWPSMYRTTKCIVAAKPTNDEFAIFVTTGKRVSYRKREPAIIGYDTPANNAVMKRMYRAGLPMQQAVMLAIYLLSQSKARDVGVGGDSQIVIVRDNGPWIEYPEYIDNSESRIAEFLKLTDDLFLSSIDVSISPSTFPAILENFRDEVSNLRDKYLRQSAAISLRRTLTDPKYRGEPYPKQFLGAITTVMSNGAITVRQETPEELEHHRKLFEAAKQSYNQVAEEKFLDLIADRQMLYIGEEKVHIRGSAGPVTDSDIS